jgi:hypothetical protein
VNRCGRQKKDIQHVAVVAAVGRFAANAAAAAIVVVLDGTATPTSLDKSIQSYPRHYERIEALVTASWHFTDSADCFGWHERVVGIGSSGSTWDMESLDLGKSYYGGLKLSGMQTACTNASLHTITDVNRFNLRAVSSAAKLWL